MSIVYKGGGAEFCPSRKGRDAFRGELPMVTGDVPSAHFPHYL